MSIPGFVELAGLEAVLVLVAIVRPVRPVALLEAGAMALESSYGFLLRRLAFFFSFCYRE